MTEFDHIKTLNIDITKISYKEILDYVKKSIAENQKRIISYAAFHTLNLTSQSSDLTDKINSFDIVHPDGTGVYFASKLLYGGNGFRQRINGSDLYLMLIDEAVKNNWSFYFLGDTNKTLNKISGNYPSLKISGMHDGYTVTDDIINDINEKETNILIIGMGSPKQENWVIKNKGKINVNVILVVGDGIKVFTGLKKRGPVLIRKLGLEWFFRLLHEPRKLAKRYLFGIPLFLLRVIKSKFEL